MNLTLLGALLILGGYAYGTLLYEPWYTQVQKWFIAIGLVTLPPDTTEEAVRLLGTKGRIIAIGVLAIIIGIWMFALGSS
jgi:hypothetical protein